MSLKRSPAVVKEREAQDADFQTTERCPHEAGAKARASVSIRPPAPGIPVHPTHCPPPPPETSGEVHSPGGFNF